MALWKHSPSLCSHQHVHLNLPRSARQLPKHTYTHIHKYRPKPKQQHSSGALVVSPCFSDNKKVLGWFFISNLRTLHWKCHEIDPQARPLVWYGITCEEHHLLNLMFNAAFYCCSFWKKAGKWKREWRKIEMLCPMHAFSYPMQKYIQTTTQKTHTRTVHEHPNGQGSPVGSGIMEKDGVNPICA